SARASHTDSTSAAAATTSCDCSGYVNYTYDSCYNEIFGNAPSDGEFAATEGIMFGIAAAGANTLCKPKSDEAQTTCREVPCPSGQRCQPADLIPGNEEPPKCIGCPSGQSFCGDVCVDLQTDNNNCGSCGHVCVSPSTC